jgi:hypothetical protein
LLIEAGGFFVWELDDVGSRWGRAFDIYIEIEGRALLLSFAEGLCALREIYGRSGRFMRAQEGLCALKEIYARSGRFMRA